MLNYKMSVYALESELGLEYVAEYPALKGVAGTGSTVSEAIEDLSINAEENIKLLLEVGLPVPVSDIVVDLEDYSGKLSVRLSKNMHRMLSEFSESQGVSINQCIVEAISSYVSEKKVEYRVKEHLKSVLYKELYNYELTRTTYINFFDEIFKYGKPYQVNFQITNKSEELSYA